MPRKSLPILLLCLWTLRLGAEYREAGSPPLVVVYPAGLEARAAEVLHLGLPLLQETERFWNTSLKGDIRVLLLSRQDRWGPPVILFPDNQIVLSLIPPPPHEPDSEPDRLRRQLAEGFHRLIMLQSGRGFHRALRPFLGRFPIFYPLYQMPQWLLKGLSQILARAQTGAPELSPEDLALARALVREDRFPPMSVLSGDPLTWPYQETKYRLGPPFVRFLLQAAAPVNLPSFIHRYASFFYLAQTRTRIRRILGREPSVFWAEWEQALQEATPPLPPLSPAFTALRVPLEDHHFPSRTPQGTVASLVRHPGRPDTLTAWSSPHKAPPLLVQEGINGLCWQEGSLYFTAFLPPFRGVSHSDLFTLERGTGLVRRLSRHQRLFFPAPGPPHHLWAVQRQADSSILVSFPASGPHPIRNTPVRGEQLGRPAWSPRNGMAALPILLPGASTWALALWNPERKQLSIWTLPGQTRCAQVCWSSDGQTLWWLGHFAEGRRLVSWKPQSPQARIWSDPGSEDLYDLSPSGSSGPDAPLLCTRLRARGLELLSLDTRRLNRVRHLTMRAVPAPQAISPDRAETFPHRPHQVLQELQPKYLGPLIRKAGREFQPGLMTSGYDLMGRYEYRIRIYSARKPSQPNYGVSLLLSRDPLSLSLGVSRYSYHNLDAYVVPSWGRYHQQEGEGVLRAEYRLFQHRQHRALLVADLHWETIRACPAQPEDGPGQRWHRAGFTLGLVWDGSERFYHSFSRNRGFSLALCLSRDMKAWGSQYPVDSVALEGRQYLELPSTNVLAWRLGFAHSSGPGRLFLLGGSVSDEKLYQPAGRRMFQSHRALPVNFETGRGGWVFNGEFRWRLGRLEREHLGPKRVERAYIAFFTDIGNMWEDRLRMDPCIGVGAEINLKVYYGELWTVCAGVARSLRPNIGWQFYVRLGESF